jgi:Fur family transcriptional regulator, ferric uptake regulator
VEVATVSKLAEIERRCADHRVRMTEQRRAVLRVVAEATDHPDVEELHRRAQRIDPAVSLSTLYRTVRLLEAIGVLQRHEFTDGRSRYELMPERHHDHLIDVETGRVTEFHSPEIERLQAEIARRHGYRILDHRLDIYVVPLQSPIKEDKP